MPMTNSNPSHGMTAAMPWCSIAVFTNGVITMPPTDSPVLATDRASERRRWNQRVTTVVAGTMPHNAHPTPNTM